MKVSDEIAGTVAASPERPQGKGSPLRRWPSTILVFTFVGPFLGTLIAIAGFVVET
jgi:hypothetical protein